MINDLISYFKDKKILILGFGREGKSTYNLIRKYLTNQLLYIADQKENFEKDYELLKNDKNLKFISGKNYLDNLNDYDIIMKSPGISFKDVDCSNLSSKIKSQLELLLEFFDNKTIGITGTKGKSTTSSLIYQVLKDQNINTLLLGNIGVPVFDFIETLKKDTTIVLEMSSHQLEFMRHSPNIAILLNVYEEHLDHYNSFNEYAEAKCNIYKYQNENDYFLYNSDNDVLQTLVKNPNAKTYKVSLAGDTNCSIYLNNNEVYFENTPIYNGNEPRKLIGDHNLNNIMFVLGVSKILNLKLDETIKTISEFETLHHRLEFVGKYNDILFYDNSIATIPKATIEAIKALKIVDTLIIGGMDRGLDYREFAEFLNKSDVNNIICMPKTGHDISKMLNNDKAHIVETLEEAVSLSKQITAKNKICILSPAAASYGFFKNFEEKGDKFKELVRK